MRPSEEWQLAQLCHVWQQRVASLNNASPRSAGDPPNNVVSYFACSDIDTHGNPDRILPDQWVILSLAVVERLRMKRVKLSQRTGSPLHPATTYPKRGPS